MGREGEGEREARSVPRRKRKQDRNKAEMEDWYAHEQPRWSGRGAGGGERGRQQRVMTPPRAYPRNPDIGKTFSRARARAREQTNTTRFSIHHAFFSSHSYLVLFSSSALRSALGFSPPPSLSPSIFLFHRFSVVLRLFCDGDSRNAWADR